MLTAGAGGTLPDSHAAGTGATSCGGFEMQTMSGEPRGSGRPREKLVAGMSAGKPESLSSSSSRRSVE
ncbi:hypothetical protein PC123_g15088 [Phytophthora cactorum]|nr:hypothetical protein PC120_g20094 [Phytophthora cactorum]KAG4049634.1 hypothetical protein PC123_g15088 [Phytophthora cactorum]